jgi:hypothetical protein
MNPLQRRQKVRKLAQIEGCETVTELLGAPRWTALALQSAPRKAATTPAKWSLTKTEVTAKSATRTPCSRPSYSRG